MFEKWPPYGFHEFKDEKVLHLTVLYLCKGCYTLISPYKAPLLLGMHSIGLQYHYMSVLDIRKHLFSTR